MRDIDGINIVRISTADPTRADGTATFVLDDDQGRSVHLKLSADAVQQLLGYVLKVRTEGASALLGEGATVAVKKVSGVNIEWYQGGGIGLCLLLSRSPDAVPLRYKLDRAAAEGLASNLRQVLLDHKP